MSEKISNNKKNIIIFCLFAMLVIETIFYFNQKSTGSSFDLNALNKLDAQEVLNEYLLAHKTGEKELLTLRLLDDFYDKSDEYLSTHSDVYNIKSVDVKSIEEIMNVKGIGEATYFRRGNGANKINIRRTTLCQRCTN